MSVTATLRLCSADVFCFLQGLSIACSTPEAIVWDESWADTHEISGRAMKLVHDSGSSFELRGHASAENGIANGITA